MFSGTFAKTRQAFFGKIASLVGGASIPEEMWDDIEAILVQADVGIPTATYVVDTLRRTVVSQGLRSHESVMASLKEILAGCIPISQPVNLDPQRLLNVVLVVGVNGTGKTTSIAKLAKHYKDEGWSVVLAAADTFRAAAIDQLQNWGGRIDIPVIAGQPGADPGAVAYDAIRAARARQHNLLLVDTAGRLHTKFNLMEELKKVRTVMAKNVHEAPHETWLVLDGTTGQNAVSQVKSFNEAIPLTGLIVTKLDSSAKGGMLLAIGHEIGLPVRFIGSGEQVVDLVSFDTSAFVNSLFPNGA